MNPVGWGGYHERTRGGSPSLPYIGKRIDNFSSPPPDYPQQSPVDFLVTIRKATEASWNNPKRPTWFGLEEDLSGNSGRTRLSLPEELDSAALRPLWDLKPTFDENHKAQLGCYCPMEWSPIPPSRSLHRHSAGEIYGIQPPSPLNMFKSIWTHQSEMEANEPEPEPAPAPAQNFSRYSGNRRKPFRRSYQGFCAFCNKNNESHRMVTSHNLYYPSSDIVSCPVLRNYSCKWCGATGDHAHTDSYCPWRKSPRKPKKLHQHHHHHQEHRAEAGGPKPIGPPKMDVGASREWYRDNFPPLPSTSPK